MKTVRRILAFQFLLALIVSGCNFSDTKEAGPELIANNSPVTNTFVVSTLDGMYNSGENINLSFTFPFNVIVTGVPKVQINVGGSLYDANYISGNGSKILTFRYTVVPNDQDNNGIDVVGPIDLNGGTLQFDLSGTLINCGLTFTTPNTASVLVDATIASISSFPPPANTLYPLTRNLDFNINFTEAVYITGTPRLVLDVGGVTKYANYLQGSATSTITFRFTVGATDVDLNGISVASPIDSNGGTINDIGANTAALSFLPPGLPGVLVNGDLPIVSSSLAPAAKTYLLGENVDFTFTFSEDVDITGVPRLLLDVSGTTRYANYLSGTGTNSVIFRYIVQPNDSDLNGIDVMPVIDLNTGSILDGALNPAYLLYNYIPTGGILVDANIPEITLITPPVDATYLQNQYMNFTVRYDQNVDIIGTPSLALNIGGTTVQASYLSGSGGQNLIFQYVVVNGDQDVDGIGVVSPLTLNGGTVRGLNTINANLTFSAPDTSAVLVGETGGPTITSVTPPANARYKIAQNLDFIVNFTEDVVVTGTPRISVDIGGSSVYADYVSGTTTSALLFRYIVIAADEDTDGITHTSPLGLNAGTIKSLAGDNAILSFTPADTSAVLVDGVIPSITSVTPPTGASYNEVANLDFIVNYSENVNVVGTPRIQVTVGVATVYASYASGTGTNALTFSYDIQPLDVDSDGISHISPLDLNSGTISDDATNNANLVFTPADTSAVLVDTTAPSITSITAPADATYAETQDLDFIVNFDENVIVTGTPRIQITLDSGTVYADYTSGDTTSALTFRYTAVNGDLDTDGISISLSIDLNTGTIKDAATNISSLTYADPGTTGIMVNATQAIILSVVPPADTVYLDTQFLDFTVNFSNLVNVTGTPRIAITLSTGTVYANYLSGTASTALIFRYIVATNDEDLDGITLASPLELNLGTIKDASLGDASLTYTLPTTTGIHVDATTPTIISSTPPADASYKELDNIDFTFTFSESV
ncbi:hypothetical protein N9B72_02295, partial [Bacteriovoracaceae bacterium]|nr:hypothetical protein [Bacteriovoracaceae bacterium]